MSNPVKRILIADENEEYRKSFGAYIEGLGYEVVEAASGPEAVDKASALRPDLILMDLRLPGMAGDEATARIKANRNTRNIPIIINTAWTTSFNVEVRADRARNAGAEEVLFRPLQLPIVRDVLRTYLRQSYE